MTSAGVRPRFTMACEGYDRVQPLRDGSVRLGGAELNVLTLPVEETFYRMLHFQEFDIAELSMSSYTMTLSRERPFVAVPVFVSRAFRHSGIYVRTDSPLTQAAELSGLTVGVPEYQITASVWIRGILADHHGVPVDSVRYRTGGLTGPGRTEKVALDLPEGIDVAPVPAGKHLVQMLKDGELDAVYTARNPWPGDRPDRGLRRLYADPAAVEQEYFARTGIFPIMHVLAIRRDVYEQHRWLPRELLKACESAKLLTMQGLTDTASLRYTLPWLWAEVERTRALLGEDYWPYGLPANRNALETFLRYHHEQGLSPRRYEPEELFAVETLSEVVV